MELSNHGSFNWKDNIILYFLLGKPKFHFFLFEKIKILIKKDKIFFLSVLFYWRCWISIIRIIVLFCFESKMIITMLLIVGNGESLVYLIKNFEILLYLI